MEFLPSHPLGSTREGRSPSHLSSQGSHLLLCSRRGVGRETQRAWAQGHQQHQVSFHLYKDSLTPEHVNTLNDRERRWDSRPAPPLRLPSPPLLSPLGPSSSSSLPSLSYLSPSVSCLSFLSFLFSPSVLPLTYPCAPAKSTYLQTCAQTFTFS